MGDFGIELGVLAAERSVATTFTFGIPEYRLTERIGPTVFGNRYFLTKNKPYFQKTTFEKLFLPLFSKLRPLKKRA
jgi:hypothetical protein